MVFAWLLLPSVCPYALLADPRLELDVKSCEWLLPGSPGAVPIACLRSENAEPLLLEVLL